MERAEEKQEKSYSFSDEELREAAVKVMHAMADALPVKPEQEHVFSERFETKMRKLIRKSRVMWVCRGLARGAAVLLLAALITASVWLAFDGEARADFLQWVRNEYESGVVYKFFAWRGEKRLPKIEFGWLPEEYTESTATVNEEYGYYVYTQHGSGDILFYYCFMYSDSSYSITRDNGVAHEEVLVNGKGADFYLDKDKENQNMLFWSDDALGIKFSLTANLEKEVMVKIAENIKIIG